MSDRSKIALVYLLGFVVDLANMFVINAAYPALQRELHASVAELVWIGNAYMLGLTVVIPFGAWLARRCGERHLFIASLLLFSLGSAGAGAARSIEALLAWRLLQGLGGGLLIPVGQAMAYRAYPPQARARLTSIVMMVTLLVPALSPALGGAIADQLSWRGIFFGMLPLAAVTAALAWLWLREEKGAAPAEPLDVPGLASSSLAIAALLLGLSCAGQSGQGIYALASLVVALLAGVFYLRHARRAPAPLLNLRLLRQPLLRTGIVIYLCVPGVFTGVNLIAALYLQTLLGLSAAQTGALMLPWALASFVAIATTRWRFAVWGARPLLVVGVLVHAAGIALLAAPPVTAQAAGRVLAFAAMGFGASLCTSTAQSAAFLDVPAQRMGEASALWNINRQLSFCLGAAVLGSALNLLLSTADASATPLAYSGCFLIAAALTLLPLPLLARLRREDAAVPSLSLEPSDPS